MSATNHTADDQVECPLCMEPLEVDDLNFYPCTCGYQICRFCWHRIRTDENELCPACRKAYPENPADFTPLSQEQIAALKAEKRQRDQQRKQKISENRKHLANVRVVQKNLVFVVGLPPRLAEAEILKKHEYFGKYGKIHKVVINPSTTYAGVQGPSASAYVTYVINNDALRAIQSVNNIIIDGRVIKTSLGTTKYCSHFMKNQTCPKPDCMYLHELGDTEASFTKEEMHQGKHQEYEKRLHDALIALTQQQEKLDKQQTSLSTSPTQQSQLLQPPLSDSPNSQLNGLIITTTSTTPTSNGLVNKNGNDDTTIQNKDAWPSLSTSPTTNNKINGKNGKDSSRKHDKTKTDKSKNNKKLLNGNHHKELSNTSNESIINKNIKNHHHSNLLMDDDEIAEIENDALYSDLNDDKNDTPSISSTTSSNNGDSGTVSESTSGKSSPGTFPDHPHSTQAASSTQLNNTSNNLINSSSTNSHKLSNQNGLINESTSSLFNEPITTTPAITTAAVTTTSQSIATPTNKLNGLKINNNLIDAAQRFSKLNIFDDNSSFFSHNTFPPYNINNSMNQQQQQSNKLNGDNNSSNNIINNSSSSSNNNNNQIHINSQLPDLLNGTGVNTNNNNDMNSDDKDRLKLLNNMQQHQMQLNNGFTNQQQQQSHLNHLQQLQNTMNDNLLTNTSDDWEAAFKRVMMNNKTNSKQFEDQEELTRMQEIQKRNNLINSNSNNNINGIQIPQFNSYNADYNADYFHNHNDFNRLSQAAIQQQHQRHNNMHSDVNHIYAGNMSKFFDFHKNQSQPQNQQYLLNGHGNNSEQMNMSNLLDNNRLNSHFLDQHSNGLLGSQMQKQRLLNKYDQMNSHNLMLNNQQSQQQQHLHQQQQQQSRLHSSSYTQNSSADDDLGFDPFIETQKGLAELINDEILNQQQTPQSKLIERTRMPPPPGFNHMNAFGFGVPRAQGSKILPFMNLSNNNSQQQQQSNWNQHMNFNPQNSEQSHPHSQQNGQINKNGGYGSNFNNSDWTSFDPAIVSFRQFPSFINNGQPQQQQQQQQPQNQQNSNELFLPPQQQNLHGGQGFGHHGMGLLNQQQQQQQSNSPAQVNFPHTNWLNTDQNMYMNNLTNGFTNNFEKFSIPMPPGFQNNVVTGNNKQKAECIN